jgi:hypothetical protein
LKEKIPKATDVDRILRYLEAGDSAKEPFQLTEKEREKWMRMSSAHELRKKGYTKKQVVDRLMSTYELKYLNDAYVIIRDAETFIGATSGSPKAYARALAEEWILKGIRVSIENKDLRYLEKFTSKYMKLHGLEDLEAMSIPADALEKRHQVHLTMNPEDVGMKRLSKEEILQFMEEMKKTPRKRVIDVTPKGDE